MYSILSGGSCNVTIPLNLDFVSLAHVFSRLCHTACSSNEKVD
jgi:hypothetical protein